MLISRSLIVAAMLAGLGAVSFAQAPASVPTTQSPAGVSAGGPVAATDGQQQAGVKKVASKRKPAKKQQKIAKKRITKRVAKPVA